MQVGGTTASPRTTPPHLIYFTSPHQVRCSEEGEEEGEVCTHQLVEALRWEAMPLREVALASGWAEFQLMKSDPSFLADMVAGREGREGREAREVREGREGTSHTKMVSDAVGANYSPNRLHSTRDDFVVYTSLGVDLATLASACHQVLLLLLSGPSHCRLLCYFVLLLLD